MLHGFVKLIRLFSPFDLLFSNAQIPKPQRDDQRICVFLSLNDSLLDLFNDEAEKVLKTAGS